MADAEEIFRVLDHADCLPIFPLEGMVLLPDTLIPLHVFEPRYIQLVEDVSQSHGLICMPNLRIKEGDGPVPDLHLVAGVGKIVKRMELPNKRYFVILLGVGVVDIELELEGDRLYRQVKASVRFQENEELPLEAQSEMRLLLQGLLKHGASKIKQLKQITAFLELSEFRLSELNALAGGCIREAQNRQAYLEMEELSSRIELVTNGLADALIAVTEESD